MKTESKDVGCVAGCRGEHCRVCSLHSALLQEGSSGGSTEIELLNRRVQHLLTDAVTLTLCVVDAQRMVTAAASVDVPAAFPAEVQAFALLKASTEDALDWGAIGVQPLLALRRHSRPQLIERIESIWEQLVIAHHNRWFGRDVTGGAREHQHGVRAAGWNDRNN